jgi:hypothetical protein
MIFSYQEFLNGFAENEMFKLPVKRIEDIDYYTQLKNMLDNYIILLNRYTNEIEHPWISEIKKLNACILDVIVSIYNGDSQAAEKQILKIVNDLLSIDQSGAKIVMYEKKGYKYSDFRTSDPLYLYRCSKIENDKPKSRNSIFHVPYNLREIVSHSRYSLSGRPSLYLATSIELALSEVKNTNDQYISQYKINREAEGRKLVVLEFSIKPSDFILNHYDGPHKEIYDTRRFDENRLGELSLQRGYIHWYPLFAACSFIKLKKDDKFVPEYLISQLLLTCIDKKSQDTDTLYGIRYFSCSDQDVDCGFNYVFPTGEKINKNEIGKKNYSQILTEEFTLTSPVNIEGFTDEQKNIDYDALKEHLEKQTFSNRG